MRQKCAALLSQSSIRRVRMFLEKKFYLPQGKMHLLSKAEKKEEE